MIAAPSFSLDTTLREVIEDYAAGRDVTPEYIRQLGFAVQDFGRWLDHEPTVADLNDRTASAWIQQRLTAAANRSTLKGRRASVLTLWRFVADMLPEVAEPKRVVLLKRRDIIVRAWTVEQVCRIVDAASMFKGRTQTGIVQAAMYRALFVTAYYSGLRPVDLRAVTRENLAEDGLLRFVQSKTGVEQRVLLPTDCLDAIAATFPPDRQRLFPIHRTALDYMWGRIKLKTGVPGSMKWFRRSGATHVEALYPGAAMGFLGHKTAGMCWRSYIDRSQLPFEQRIPPPLPAGTVKVPKRKDPMLRVMRQKLLSMADVAAVLDFHGETIKTLAELSGFREGYLSMLKAGTRALTPEVQGRLRAALITICSGGPRIAFSREVWSAETARRIIEAAGELPGSTFGIPRGKLMQALCLTAWHTRMRPRSLLALRADQAHALPAEAADAIAATFPPQRARIFPFGKEWVRKWFTTATRAAGATGGFARFRTAEGGAS